MFYVIIAIATCIITTICVSKYYSPRLKVVVQRNDALIQENQQAEKERQNLAKAKHDLSQHLILLNGDVSAAKATKTALAEQIEEMRSAAASKAEEEYNNTKELLNERFSAEADKKAEEYRLYAEEAKAEYESMLADLATELVSQTQETTAAITSLSSRLMRLRADVTAATEAAKRQAEMAEKQDFYRVQISNTDLLEIEKLREVAQFLRDPEPLNKVIWKVYYENPTSDLIGRVIGSERITGIYKITHIQSGKCYVGQATDVSARFKQHIKRGLGADTPTRNKLYPAMAKYGIENFTFEIIESCKPEDLDSREDYWQEYFHAKEYGFSIK